MGAVHDKVTEPEEGGAVTVIVNAASDVLVVPSLTAMTILG